MVGHPSGGIAWRYGRALRVADTEVLEEISAREGYLGEHDGRVRRRSTGTKPFIERTSLLQVKLGGIKFASIRPKQSSVVEETRLPDLVPVVDEPAKGSRCLRQRQAVGRRICRWSRPLDGHAEHLGASL